MGPQVSPFQVRNNDFSLHVFMHLSIIDFGQFLIPGLFDAPSRLKGGDLDKNGCL